MEHDAIAEGIRLGGLTSEIEIRILICYLLSNLSAPLSQEQLNAALTENGLVNYFDLSAALSSLTASEHIVKTQSGGESFYAAAPLGRQTAQSLGKSIPASVKDKALTACIRLLSKLREMTDTAAEIEKTEDGYLVHCTILDAGTDLLHLSLFMPDLLQAEKTKEQFLMSPGEVYEDVIAALLKERK